MDKISKEIELVENDIEKNEQQEIADLLPLLTFKKYFGNLSAKEQEKTVKIMEGAIEKTKDKL